MDSGFTIGLVWVVLSGLLVGSGAWPFKCAKDLRFEIYLFVWSLVSVIIIPWAITFLFVVDLPAVLKSVGWEPILKANLLSCAWGVANILYLVCVIKIGAALTGAILSALGMSVGVIVPMVFKASGLFKDSPDLLSMTGFLTVLGLVIIIIGITMITSAGMARERLLKKEVDEEERRRRASGNFLEGFILVCVAGVLSAGHSLAFAYTQDSIVEAVTTVNESRGSIDPTILGSFVTYAVAITGGALVNFLYAVYAITKKKMWGLFFVRKAEVLYGFLAGLQFFAALACVGYGMIRLGAFGASIGFGIQQSIQMIANQMVGFLGGEWKGVRGGPRRMMYLAILVIILAVIWFAAINYLRVVK